MNLKKHFLPTRGVNEHAVLFSAFLILFCSCLSTDAPRKRHGWLRVKPVWLDIEKTCFKGACGSPYSLRILSSEITINHTAAFYMDINDPAPLVDMYFPAPLVAENTENSSVNFSVGLYGRDREYAFFRYCHQIIEKSLFFKTHQQKPFYESFSAECLNLTFEVTVIPDASSADSRGKVDHFDQSISTDRSISANRLFQNQVPAWAVAASACFNALLILVIFLLVWRLALHARRKRHHHSRSRQRSFTSSASNSTTTPVQKRVTPPPPPPSFPAPKICDPMLHAQEAKYDVPWGANAPDRTMYQSETMQRRPQHLLNYYFATPSPVSGGEHCEIRSPPVSTYERRQQIKRMTLR